MNRKYSIGQTIHNWTIISKSDKQGYYNCICGICKKESNVYIYSITSGRSKSCCLDKQSRRKTIKHNMSNTRIYEVYSSMRGRCNNNKDMVYGGRGIKCSWTSFEGFYNDIGKYYKEGLSIDRIDVNGDYCKENCRRIPLKEQNANKRNNVRLEFNGKSLLIKERALITGIKKSTISMRYYKYKWDTQKILTTKVN